MNICRIRGRRKEVMILFQTKFSEEMAKELQAFLALAHQNGYGAGSKCRKVKEADDSTSIFFEDGPWKFHDNYAGGEPFGGREMVSYNGKPVWMMVYYGFVRADQDSNNIYPVLCRALLANSPDPAWLPLRGPRLYCDPSGMEYVFSLEGDLGSFHGEEDIFNDSSSPKSVYHAWVCGGFVNRWLMG